MKGLGGQAAHLELNAILFISSMADKYFLKPPVGGKGLLTLMGDRQRMFYHSPPDEEERGIVGPMRKARKTDSGVKGSPLHLHKSKGYAAGRFRVPGETK